MAVFDNLNATYSSGVAPSVIQYYERTLLENARANLVHCKDLQKRTLPSHNGKTVQFRRMTPFTPITEPLKEGVTPAGQTLSMTEITATVKPYGRHVELTDEMDWALLDNMHKEAADLLAQQAVESIDKVAADALSTGTNVIYVDSTATPNSSRTAIVAADKLSHDYIKKAVRTLEKNNAKKFPDGYYHAIIDPDTKFDLTADAIFTNTSQYQDKSKIEKYELGTIYGVKFYESTQTKTFPAQSYVYGTVSSVALTAGSAATKQITVAASTISANADEVAQYIRIMAGKEITIHDEGGEGADVLFPAVIDRVEKVGTNLIHHLRWIGSTTWTYANGDLIVPPQTGSSNYEVHSTIVYGQNAAGCVELEGNGKNVSIIVKPNGSSGALDPLNQRGTIAWKVKGFCVTILQDAFIVRLEHGVTA